nr:hypothetical protein [Tanacetum cinerariifolium]
MHIRRIRSRNTIDSASVYAVAFSLSAFEGLSLKNRLPKLRHTSEGDHRAVRTHMQILSVVRIEVFSMYGYDYMKNIILRRADLNEHIIAERDFKYLYPSDFEDLYLLNLQEDFQLRIESYQTQLNLTKPRWDATGFEYKHDYMIDEALDYRVKEFKVNRMNLGLNTRFWTRKDVDRSKEFIDLPKADMKEIFHQRMWKNNSYKTHEDHMMLYEALEKSMNRNHPEEILKDLVEVRKKKKKDVIYQKRHLGLHLISHLLLQHQQASGSPGDFGSSQVPPPPPPPLSTNQEGQSQGSVASSSSKTATSAEYQAWTTIDIRLSHIKNAHILKVNLQQDWWKPLKEERPATPEPAWPILSSDVPVLKNNWASALASNYSPPLEDSLYQMEECHKLLTDGVDDSILRHNVSKPLPLGGPPGQHLTDSVNDPILSHNVSKPLPLGGPPGQVTIQSDFFFNKDLEYLRYDSKVHRPALSISKMKAAYYPDAVLEQMDATGYEYKHDYTIIDSPRAAIFQDKYGVQMMMHVNEIHNFSDDTLQQIHEALDYRIKEFRINRMNPGLNTRFWTRKDLDRSKAFMFAIQRRLKTRRIFRNLESFVGGRIREGDYRLLKRTE